MAKQNQLREPQYDPVTRTWYTSAGTPILPADPQPPDPEMTTRILAELERMLQGEPASPMIPESEYYKK